VKAPDENPPRFTDTGKNRHRTTSSYPGPQIAALEIHDRGTYSSTG